ncbi:MULTISPECIES: hypothetical protein [unclassified Thioalkalivibrio]|uniref:hypothetical protein n=1 Tax=unclassified Thioalkalivibrio TaxID=2621013 RepID=UPI0003762B7E|nr:MULTISPECIES: hypothetical protein [unclassified Thioalkalivibrio]
MNDTADQTYNNAAQHLIELANRLADDGQAAETGDVADGLLAGAVHFWLYSRQPCGDPLCEDCAPFSDAESRLAMLHELIDELARDSDYFHATTDTTVGHA